MNNHDKSKEKFLKNLKRKFGESTTLLSGDDEEFIFSCEACGSCCKNRIGQDSVILSPFDTFMLCKNLDMTFHELYDEHLDSCIGSGSGLPVLYLDSHLNNQTTQLDCTFLRKFGKNYRCMVHDFKPVVCAIYPLGRVGSYDLKDKTNEKRELDYIFLADDCANKGKKNTHVNTLKTWVKDRDVTEKAFLAYTDAITSLVKKFNFANFHKSETIGEREKDVLFNSMAELLFGKYDFNKDFFEQFESNMKELEAVVELLFSINISVDPSIADKDFKKLKPEEMMKRMSLLLDKNKI